MDQVGTSTVIIQVAGNNRYPTPELTNNIDSLLPFTYEFYIEVGANDGEVSQTLSFWKKSRIDLEL